MGDEANHSSVELAACSRLRVARPNARLPRSGLARLERVAPDHVDDVQRLIFDHLDEEQTTALADALNVVATALCQHPEYLNPRP